MPRVVVTAGATRGLERCRHFLATKNSRASVKAAKVIAPHFLHLENNREIGRPYRENADLRELVISYGESGYVALYRYDLTSDVVFVLAFRH